MTTSTDTHNVSIPFSAVDFFRDSPWLSIPECRQAKILIEPIWPPGRLLGGSSTQSNDLPTSKLAALAAARKKENRAIPSESVTTRSVALLDKLKRNNNQPPRGQPRISFASESDSKASIPSSVVPKRYPVRKSRENLLPRMPSKPAKGDEQSKEDHHKQTVQTKVPPAAAPSLFAKTIFGSTARNADRNPPFSRYSRNLEAEPVTNLNAFIGPSPDDVVLKAQGSSKGSK